jgi:hypothetical protein
MVATAPYSTAGFGISWVNVGGHSSGHQLELVGDLAGILDLGALDMTKPPRLARAGVVSKSDLLVAGAHFQKFLPLHQQQWRDLKSLAA